MMEAEDWIERLGMEEHPEGGMYVETWRSPRRVDVARNGERVRRDASTAIYYLLRAGEVSVFHRLASDEVWHHYDGGDLLLHVLSTDGGYECHRIGIGPDALPQRTVPAGDWFAAEPADQTDFVLCGCTVAPGFEFDDFELTDADDLLDRFPDHTELIRRLGRG